MNSFSSLLFIAFFVTLACSSPVTQNCGDSDWKQVRSKINSLIKNDADEKKWPARLIRVGFHDCFAGSCDASIAFELDRPENIRIERTIDFLRRANRGTCVSLADTIKIGLEVSMKIVGAPSLSCPLGTEDATEANPEGSFPFPDSDFKTIMDAYRSKGFTYEEGMAGNFGGHSIGGFGGSRNRRKFTPTENRYGNDFANILVHDTFGVKGYNAVPSDLALSFWDERNVVQGFVDDKSKLDAAFKSFMTKLCRM